MAIVVESTLEWIVREVVGESLTGPAMFHVHRARRAGPSRRRQ